MSHVGAFRIIVALRWGDVGLRAWGGGGGNTIPISFNIKSWYRSAINDNYFCQTDKNCEKKVPLVIYHSLSAWCRLGGKVAMISIIFYIQKKEFYRTDLWSFQQNLHEIFKASVLMHCNCANQHPYLGVRQFNLLLCRFL